MDVQSPTDRAPRIPGHTWQFNFDSKAHSYLSTTHTNIRTLDSSESDTVTSIIRFTITIDHTHLPVIISGIVDRVEVRAGNKIGIDSSKIQLPISFKGVLNGHKVELDLSRPSDTHSTTVSPTCMTPAIAVLGEIRLLLTTLPQEITTGLKWSDTVSTTTCNTIGISSTINIIRSYDILTDTTYPSSDALAIRRLESTEVNGGGAQGQHEVTLTGNGTGSTTIYVDRRGVLLAINSSQNLALTMTASGRSNHFNQHSEQTIKLLD